MIKFTLSHHSAIYIHLCNTRPVRTYKSIYAVSIQLVNFGSFGFVPTDWSHHKYSHMHTEMQLHMLADDE